MVHGWIRRVAKRLISAKRKKGETPTSLQGFLRYMGSRLHVETGCRKVYAGEVSE